MDAKMRVTRLLLSVATIAAFTSCTFGQQRPETGTNGGRVWTSQDGLRTATATLLSVGGQTVYLRKSIGKLAVTSLDQLSGEDRQYVAATVEAKASVAKRPMHGATDLAPAAASPARAPSLGHAMSLAVDVFLNKLRSHDTDRHSSDQIAAPGEDERVSGYLVWVRISRDFVDRYATGRINWHTPVTDNILGTSLSGSATTTGAVRLSLKPSRGQVLADLIFSGRIESRTTGYNWPIITSNSARTQIEASKPLRLDDVGLQFAGLSYRGQTWSNTDSVESELPRIRGRISRRIGARRAEEMRPAINNIAMQHAAERLNVAINNRLNPVSLAWQTALKNPLFKVPYASDRDPPKWHFHCTGDHLDIVLYRASAKVDERTMKPPKIEPGRAVAMRIHRAVIGRAIHNSHAREYAERLVSLFVKQRKDARAISLDGAEPAKFRLSDDRQWVMLDLASP
jgi:hypothetical protein